MLAAGVAGLACISGGGVWFCHARHLHYAGMIDHWGANGWGGFPDRSSPLALLMWPVKSGIAVGNYGTREGGIALLILAAISVRRFARENPAVAVLLITPPLLALLASYLEKYPLADRTVTFLLPGLWLAAAVGVGELARLWPNHRWPLVIPFALLASDLITCGKHLAAPPAYPATRSAFEYVREHRKPDDTLWISHAEVYEVYYGEDSTVCAGTTFPDDVVRRAGECVWLVDQPAVGFSIATPLVAKLQAAGYVETERQVRPGVVLIRLTRTPPPR